MKDTKTMSVQTPSLEIRYWEIDLLRGTAVVMMVVFHIIFDLSYFSIFPLNVITGFWRYFAILTALIFVSLVGISLNISFHRAPSPINLSWYKKYLKRGGGILLLGIIITVVTFFAIGEGFILFGVLHCIGASILIAPLFFARPRITLATGIIFLAGGFLVKGIHGPLWLAWIGVHPETFYTLDYFPLFPWFGVVLLGLSIGAVIYPGGRRTILPGARAPRLCQPVCWLGQHSLVLYLLHQPVILAVLALLFPGSLGLPL